MSQRQVQPSLNLPLPMGNDIAGYAQHLGRELQRQWRELAIVVNNSHQIYYEQDTEPTLPTNSLALWLDTGDNKRYLIINFGGVQGKTQFNVVAKKIVGGTLNMSGAAASSGP